LDLLNRVVLHSALLWIRVGNIDPTGLWATFEPLLPEIVSRLQAGIRLIEVPFGE